MYIVGGPRLDCDRCFLSWRVSQESGAKKTDLFWRWNLDDAQPDTIFGRDFLMAHVECWLSARRPPSRVDALGFEFGMAEIHADTAAGVGRAVFPLAGRTLAKARLDLGASLAVVVQLA